MWSCSTPPLVKYNKETHIKVIASFGWGRIGENTDNFPFLSPFLSIQIFPFFVIQISNVFWGVKKEVFVW